MQPQRKTPTEVVQDAAASLSAALVFPSEQAALDWARVSVTSLLRHKLENMQMPQAERDVMDPIDAGYVHASHLGTRPRRQRIPWMDALLTEIADACFCELVPLRGTISSWLIGRRSDRQTAMQLMASLVPTAERLGQDAYLREYHSNRKAGDLEATRGFKEKWHMKMIEDLHEDVARQQEHVIAEAPAAAEAFHAARTELNNYMNENFLQTRGNKNERHGGVATK